MTEIWKDIEGYEGIYQISSHGRVKSFNYRRSGKERVLTNNIVKGYHAVTLAKDGKHKRLYVHRLVAFAFIDNLDNKPHIDHIDTVRDNNHYKNLKWCTRSENAKNPITQKVLRKVRKSQKRRSGYKQPKDTVEKRINKIKKEVHMIDVDSLEILKTFESVTYASNETGIQASKICAVCKNKRKSTGGYKWEYAYGK